MASPSRRCFHTSSRISCGACLTPRSIKMSWQPGCATSSADRSMSQAVHRKQARVRLAVTIGDVGLGEQSAGLRRAANGKLCQVDEATPGATLFEAAQPLDGLPDEALCFIQCLTR